MYNQTYVTRYGDYKDFDTIKTSTILDIVQDISIADSKSHGFGIHHMRDIGLAWLMQGINVRFLAPVKTMDNIDAFTGVGKIRGVSSERGCILSQNGQVVAKAIAYWFLMDIAKGKPTRVTQEMLDAYELYEFNDEFFEYKKPKLTEVEDVAYTVTVSNRDIDTNRHLNNVKSVELLLDAIPADFEYNSLRVFYKHEAYLGDVLKVGVTETDMGYYVQLAKENGDVCVAGYIESVPPEEA